MALPNHGVLLLRKCPNSKVVIKLSVLPYNANFHYVSSQSHQRCFSNNLKKKKEKRTGLKITQDMTLMKAVQLIGQRSGLTSLFMISLRYFGLYNSLFNFDILYTSTQVQFLLKMIRSKA